MLHVEWHTAFLILWWLMSNYALWRSKNATAIEKILLENILKASEKITLNFYFTGGIDDMSILKAKQLKKYYGSEENLTKALDGVDLSVEKGEFVAIIGASGSGKSIASQYDWWSGCSYFRKSCNRE